MLRQAKSPALSRDQLRRVDELATSQYFIPSFVLMENAGIGAAQRIHLKYGKVGRAEIFCGHGNNGGDGFVVARHLHILGWQVSISLLGDESNMTADTLANSRITGAMELPIRQIRGVHDLEAALAERNGDSILIDAILGTGFMGSVREPIHAYIEMINAAPRKGLVALDVPSGLDCDTGQPGGVAIKADMTITFAAMKIGFKNPRAKQYLGKIHVVGIGVPPEIFQEVGRNS